MIKILVVDDSALVRKLIGQVFSTQSDFAVQFARNGREALDAINLARPDVVTLDVHMPEMDGLTCLDRIMIEQPCPVIMVSSMTAAGADATLEALRLGAVDFVAKPTGAVSLRIGEMAQPLIAKVRAAAGAKLKTSLRLRDRVRHRIGEGARDLPRRSASNSKARHEGRGSGADRHVDRRPPRPRSPSDRTPGIVPLAHRHCATHAGHVHRPVGTAPRRN